MARRVAQRPYFHFALSQAGAYAVRKAGLAGLVTFHTHPLARSDVSFSWYDDEQDPLLVENLQEFWPAHFLAASFLERIRREAGCGCRRAQMAAARLIVVGERLQYLPLDGEAQEAPKPSEIFDRATALTGSGALALLARDDRRRRSERAAQARLSANSWRGLDAREFS